MPVKTISQSLFERFENEWRQVRTQIRTPAPTPTKSGTAVAK